MMEGDELEEWIERLFQDKKLIRMGHHQRKSDLNLGLGWIYYGLARSMRPKTIVVVGSYRGFVPLVFGKALLDNEEGGKVVFIDPSFVDDFWKDPIAVRSHFAHHGVTNIRHFLMTTQEFIGCEAYASLGPVGIVFIDGHHSEEQARFDYYAFEDRLDVDGIAMFHDTAGYMISRMYGRDSPYQHRVKDFVDGLKRDTKLQFFDIPFGTGVTFVRKLSAERADSLPGGASQETAAVRTAL